MALVFDIETIGFEYDRMDETTKHNLTRWIRREAGEDREKYNVMFEDLKQNLGFSPLTGLIVAIGVFDTEAKKGVVYYNTAQSPDEDEKISYAGKENNEDRLDDDRTVENFIFKRKSEPEMLFSFWQGVKNYREFVSFNGRSFDVPFLCIRSAAHRIKPTVNLMSNRYLSSQSVKARHIDLLDQLSFYGAVRRKGSLHLYCQTFGIKSPKTQGITGDDVSELYRRGEYRRLAQYNSWDLTATYQLYQLWKNYLCLP